MAETSFVSTKVASAGLEFAARLSQLDKTVAAELKAGKRDIYDYNMYVTRFLDSDTTSELFLASDDKTVGLTNINSRQLEDKNFFLVTGVQLIAVKAEQPYESEAAAKEAAKGAIFTTIPTEIANGEFELKLGEKSLLPRISCQVFNKPADNGKPAGYYELETPKMIKPLTDIVPWLYLPKNCGGKVILKIILHGVRNN